MPDLTLTVTDAQKTRIDAAFGSNYPDETLNDAFYSNWIKEKILSPVVEDLRDSAEEPDRPFERAMLNSGVRNRWHHAHARKLKQILNRNADLN